MSFLLTRVPGKRFFQRSAHPDTSNMALAHSGSQQSSGPRRRLALDDFPAEIILHISSFLDAEATFALQQTNRRLRHTIQPSTKQLTQVHERRYLTKWMDVTKHDKRRLFCNQCREPRPRSAISASEIMRANKIHEAECLRHAQIWVCPHHFLSYQDFDKLREPYGNYGSYAFRRADKTNSCKRHWCRYIFEHGFEIWMPQFPFEGSMESRIHIASVRYRRGPNHIWDSIRSTFTRANVDRALSLIQAPICDHLLLSDKRISDDFSANDLDMRDYVWSTRMGFLNYKSAQGKERCCLICQAMGVWTMWRFHKALCFHSGPC